jgi:hypothetical protein
MKIEKLSDLKSITIDDFVKNGLKEEAAKKILE